MDMFRLLLIITTAFALSTLHAHAESDAVANCNSHNLALIVSGCTALIEQGTISDKDAAVALNRRAEAYLVRGAIDKAIMDFRKAMERDTSDERYKKRLSEVLAHRGDNEFREKLYDEAIIDYSAAIQLYPSDDVLYARRSEVYLEKNIISNAIADTQKAMQLNRDKHAYKNRLLQLYRLQSIQLEKSGDFDGAFQVLSTMITLNNTNSDLYLERARFCLRQELYEQALNDCNTVLRIQPNNMAAIVIRGKAQLAKRNYSSAESDFLRALEVNPEDVDALVTLGYTYEQAGDKNSEALEIYQKAIKQEPNSNLAKEGITRIQQDRVEVIKAIQAHLKVIGCYEGKIDGEWEVESKKSLDSFNLHANLTATNSEPNKDLLHVLEKYKERVCPLDDGKPICKEYVAIDSDKKGTACLIDGKWRIQSNVSVNDGCFMFNGEYHCE